MTSSIYRHENATCVFIDAIIAASIGATVSMTIAVGDIRISNQFLITPALHFAQLRLRPLNYNLRPNAVVTLA